MNKQEVDEVAQDCIQRQTFRGFEPSGSTTRDLVTEVMKGLSQTK
jgi:hypothetical protein